MNHTSDQYGRLDYENFTNYIAKAIPFFIGSMILELCISLYSKRKVYRFNDAMNSMSLGMMQEIVNIFIKPLYYVPYFIVWRNFALVRLSTDSWITWWVALIGIDFGYYWFHRAGHVINLGWATHVPHHSSDDYNLSTALRQGAFQYLFGWMFYLPLAFVCPPIVYSFHTYFNRLFQFWVHTQLIRDMGFLEHILVTPSHHRVHHGSNPEYLDKNYGGVFIIWDKIFGTFEPEKAEVRYGITTGLHSWSPIWGNIHYLVQMYEMSKHLRGFAKIQVFYKGPDWNPIKVPENKPTKQDTPYVKYDAGSDLTKWAWGYASLQLLMAVIIRKGLEAQFSSLNFISLASFALCVVWALVANGALLQKTLTLSQERIRIASSTAMVLYAVWQVNGPILLLGGATVAWAVISLLLFPVCLTSKHTSRGSTKAE